MCFLSVYSTGASHPKITVQTSTNNTVQCAPKCNDAAHSKTNTVVHTVVPFMGCELYFVLFPL